MLQYIAQWIANGCAEALNLLLTMFMSALDLDMNTYISSFSFLSTGYTVFRGLGMGLAAVLSVLSLTKFLVPSIFGAREPQDTVPGVLFKAVLAGLLVYGGNYILVEIVQIAKIPYNIFINADLETTYSFSWNFMTNLLEDVSGLSAGAIVIEAALTVIIAWNLIKLMVEVAERFMMVGILVYTSPPFFAMTASQDTLEIFKKWLKMFISSCVMMTVSVFFLKLILSGFKTIDAGATSGNIFIKLLLILATCKIAQRADSYLKQLGLGTAETGGSLLSDMIATGRSIGSAGGLIGRNSGGSRTSVLGAAATTVMKNGGAAGVLGKAVQSGVNAYKTGATMSEAAGKAVSTAKTATAAGELVPHTVRPVTESVKAAKEAVNSPDNLGKSPAAVASAAAAASAETFAMESAAAAAVVAEGIFPGLGNIADAHDTAVATAAAENAGEAQEYSDTYSSPAKPDAYPAGELDSKYSNPDSHASGREAEQNYANYGIADADGACMTYDTGSGTAELSARARACGLTIQTNDDGSRIMNGNEQAAADVIAAGTSAVANWSAVEAEGQADSAANELTAMYVGSIARNSPAVAENLAYRPDYKFNGTNAEVAQAAVSKMHPELEGVPENIRSFNYPDSVNSQGAVIKGGAGYSFTVSGKDGTVQNYECINKTAYTALSVTKREEWTEHKLNGGSVEYIRRRPVSAGRTDRAGKAGKRKNSWRNT